MRTWVGVMVIGMIGVTPLVFAKPPTWEPLSRGFNEIRLDVVAADPQHPRLLYAASAKTAYQSQDGGASWRACFRAPGQATIAYLSIDPFDSRHLLAATSRGLYGSFDGAQRWQRLFRGGGTGESICQVVLFHPARRHAVFLGTAGGLFASVDGGRAWQTAGSPLGGQSVRRLAVDPHDPQRVFALTDRGVFVQRQDDGAWDQAFDAASVDDQPDESEEPLEDSVEDAGASRRLTALAIDPHDPNRLYLASLDGLFVSADGSDTWTRVTQVGLGTAQIRDLILQAHSPAVAYAATPQGVARYSPQEGRWDVLYAGLPSRAVNRLAATDTKLYAATDQGLYVLDLTEEALSTGNWPAAREILGNFVHEPTIEQAQATAIAYAEVHPDKIKHWRRQASMQALLPTFSIGYDRDQDTYIASSVTSTTSKAITVSDPSRNFDVSLDWDLGDLIWNDDQTSIDTRSRLMVQLRDDILDEVTRNYFERRRLQIELLTDPPSDPKAQLEKELRLQELTAMIDGLTGGWFSKQLAINGGFP